MTTSFTYWRHFDFISMTTSHYFRVATEGATTDGRAIDRATILELVKSFNPQTYGARIWLEHIRGIVPDSVFKAYGDVVALKAEEVETDLGKRMALFAQISPTPDLIAMAKARQKIYTSLEINPKFADTGLPYLVGLGITDSPASLGTDVLSFAATKGSASPFASRKHNPDNWYSEAVEVNLNFDEPEPGQSKFLIALKDLLKKVTQDETKAAPVADTRFTELNAAIKTLADIASVNDQKYTAQQARLAALEKYLQEVSANFKAFQHLMDNQDSNPTQRPLATGGNTPLQTDY
jgi:hypothetical protein